MGLYIICGLLYFLIVLIGSVILIVKILINSRKVGFKKAIKSKDALDLLIMLVLLMGLPAFVIYSMFIPHSGEELVKMNLINPVPKSVELIESYDGGPDLNPETCIHFKIAPADLKLILDSQKWELVTQTNSGGGQCGSGNNAWEFPFPPPELGENVKTYALIHKEDYYEYLFVNDQMDEVYFFNYDALLP